MVRRDSPGPINVPTKRKWILQEWILNTTINERFRAFYLGFHSVCASNALIMLRPEEVEQVRVRIRYMPIKKRLHLYRARLKGGG